MVSQLVASQRWCDLLACQGSRVCSCWCGRTRGTGCVRFTSEQVPKAAPSARARASQSVYVDIRLQAFPWPGTSSTSDAQIAPARWFRMLPPAFLREFHKSRNALTNPETPGEKPSLIKKQTEALPQIQKRWGHKTRNLSTPGPFNIILMPRRDPFSLIGPPSV
jgi:hypothetical protein